MFGQATSVLLTGHERLAFGLLDSANRFVYGKTAVYLAARPTEPAQGPFLAPLDSMVAAPPYQSKTTANDPAAVKGIYEATVPFPRPGTYAVLVLSRTDSGLLAATGQLQVAARSPIPGVGQRPPQIHTATVASVRGDVAKIDTRIPPDAMHEVDFNDVIGRRPVALLFATPALCQSRTCGPVTDLLVQLQHDYGSRMAFIHNEVYVSNQPQKGYQPQLRAFHLQTEPWLFTFDRQGRVVARLEGAFGINAARKAVLAALR